MDSRIIVIGILIVIISVLIYCIKNLKSVTELFKKAKNKKVFKIFFVVILLIMFGFYLNKVYRNINSSLENISMYKFSKEKEKMYYVYDEKIKKETEFYKNIIDNGKYDIEKCKNPYIIEGFEHVEGQWNNGYVIQDTNGNQYVWIPCTNKSNDEIPQLNKYNFQNPAFISKDTCNNLNYEEFINSALNNGGFYISRFEIGKENNNPVSKKDSEIWSQVTRNEAIQIIDNMYDNKIINCKLINGYAYDTALYWIKQNNEVENSIIDCSNNVVTGRKAYNNIYDLTDNIVEITAETSYETIIVRGVSTLEAYKDCNRYSILENENFFNEDSILTFRTMLYK